ncbi:MAG: 50S ribosomal protein L10 [Clostridia bacterium]|nr:50S ribosomal protein L10 [Clostridia bacterium]MBQ8792528.1 50S ribosomal protein L10 [Clostridia bacterium]
MSANLEAKKELVEEIKNKIQSSISLTFVDYRGLTVEEDTKMRRTLREAGVEYKVYKNRLLLKALEELGMTGYDDILQGTTAVAFGMQDEVSGPRIIVETSENTKKLQVKGGILNGSRVEADMVNQLAKIPSKEVLISQLLYVLQAPVRSVAIALNAIAEKKGE